MPTTLLDEWQQISGLAQHEDGSLLPYHLLSLIER
jgi:hypothetical protein